MAKVQVQSLHKNYVLRGFARGPRPTGLSNIEWQSGDVCDLSSLEQAAQGCDAIVHLACSTLNQSFQDPAKDFAVNAPGTLNVLQAARTTKVRKIIYTSTAQVYGSSSTLPVTETTSPQPTSPYAASKLCGEILCATFARCFGLSTTILRLFNVYGPSADGHERNTVEAVFLRRAVQGLPPVIKSNPEEGRDFFHVRDVVKSIQLALDTETLCEIINIGTGAMTTLVELAELIKTLSGLSATPIIEETKDLPMRIQADTRKAKSVLGFEASISLAEGLRQMLALEQHFQEM